MLAESILILLIEDEEPHAELIIRAFAEQGSRIRIHHVKSLAEARSFMRLQAPSLLIADWRLPDGESMELLPDNIDPFSIPLILMTSYGNERIAVEALKSGALDYVVKSPESMQDMPHLVEKALEHWVARTDRIRMQEALRESEAQFRLLAENAGDMISRHAQEGTFLYISPACRTILGYPPEELTGFQHIEAIIHPEDFKTVRKAIWKNRNYSGSITFSYRARHKEGHYVWLETSARIIRDPANGNFLEIQAASRDITERKYAERALQDAHESLQQAYDRTIEGWVRALDLRDRETEGHTQRVTELAARVAGRVGFSEEEIIHIRRGALLHDMGKMAIPDEILQKPGPLTDAEWVIMRRHPIYAYEMLSPISYLLPALDIPFSHHERWDGSGYPRGLKQEQIPLSARLFAIIDVWDALSSDRPYRKKLPREEVKKYILENSGILFDSNLVEVFMEIVDPKEE
jgi:PAS domain S-box-containing protein